MHNSIFDKLTKQGYLLMDGSTGSLLIAAGIEQLQLYSWEKATRETEKVYQKVLNETLIQKTFIK